MVPLNSRLQAVSATSCTPVPNELPGRSRAAPLPPFHSWGLVFTILEVELNCVGVEVGRTNLPGDTAAWAIDDLPWGSASESANRLAKLVVRFLRPDWEASFWSHEYFEEVARDFALRFLVTAPQSGGQVTRQQLDAWLESLGLLVVPLPSSVRLVA